jgi:acyl-coenzyme A thioesterase PaaI-like protein
MEVSDGTQRNEKISQFSGDPGIQPAMVLSGVGLRVEPRSGQVYTSAFYLSCHHIGYQTTIHGGMMMALVDDVVAEYCNQAAPSLYSLTKNLWFNFIKPSPSGALFPP